MRPISLLPLLVAALAWSMTPAAADPIVGSLLPLIEDEGEGDHVVGEEMCARPPRTTPA